MNINKHSRGVQPYKLLLYIRISFVIKFLYCLLGVTSYSFSTKMKFIVALAVLGFMIANVKAQDQCINRLAENWQ